MIAAPVPEPRRAAFRHMKSPDGEAIDSGLVLWFAGPATETGEDMAEFHLHGSRAVVTAMLQTLGGLEGFRPAEPGEFARRAFENGKLDLTAVEGLADLIEAETSAQRRQALGQLGGGLSKLYEGWRERLVATMALAEAGIDFVDEDDIPAGLAAKIMPSVAALREDIERHLEDGHRGERVREGARLVIAGPPNAGKSSLLNALARRDVAIVSDVPGTTRDAIEVRLDLGGIAVTAIDTAGLRTTVDAIEAEGVRRANGHIGDADLVLLLREPGGPPAELPGGLADDRVWRVVTKSDLIDSPAKEKELESGTIAISTRSGDGLDDLLSALTRHFRT